MRILAIETSLMAGSIAALENETPLREICLDPGLRTTRTLFPALQQILQHVGWRPTDVDCVAVSVGPGSFTGLRIGVTTAKAFAYASGANVSGVNTLHVLAAQVPAAEMPLWVAMNAERNQVYASQFQSRNGQWQEASPPQIIDVLALFQTLTPGTLLTGPALHDFAKSLSGHVTATDPQLWTPRAATVGRLAHRQYLAGRRDDLWSLAPFYLRESAAQEKVNQSL